MLVGGACLEVNNLSDISDLDLISKKVFWDELQFKNPIVKTSNFTKIKVPDKIEVLVLGSLYLPNWFKNFNDNDLIVKASNINGLNYAPLDFVKNIKVKLNRPKDIIDVELIDEYLGLHAII